MGRFTGEDPRKVQGGRGGIIFMIGNKSVCFNLPTCIELFFGGWGRGGGNNFFFNKFTKIPREVFPENVFRFFIINGRRVFQTKYIRTSDLIFAL